MHVPELSAGSVDIFSARSADGGVDAGAFQFITETEHLFAGGCFVIEFRNGIIWDKVHLTDDAFKGFFQTLDGLIRARNIFDQDILKSDLTLRLFEMLTAGVNELIERIFAVDRHQKVAAFIVVTVKRDRKLDLKVLPGELFDLRHKPDGGNGDVPRADADPFFRINNADGLE